MTALSAADGLRLLADHLDTHPEMQTVEMSFLLHGLLREDVIAPFLAGADDGVEVGAYYLTRYFGPIEAQLTVKSTLTQKGPEPTPPPPPRSLRTVAEILEAVS